MGCTHSHISVVPGPPVAATLPADRPRRRRSILMSLITIKRHRGKRFNREQRQLIKKYLPCIPIYEYSTSAHLMIAANHWNAIYKEGATSTASKRSQNSWGKESKQSSALRDLFNEFYTYLEAHSPEIMFIFRSSLQVRGRVLVHISAGMRSILAASDGAATMARLTKTHLQVGVKLEHFNPLAEALFYAMEKTSGRAWTPEIEEAWKRLFVHTSALLMVDQKKSANFVARSIKSMSRQPSNEGSLSILRLSKREASEQKFSDVGKR